MYVVARIETHPKIAYWLFDVNYKKTTKILNINMAFQTDINDISKLSNRYKTIPMFVQFPRDPDLPYTLTIDGNFKDNRSGQNYIRFASYRPDICYKRSESIRICNVCTLRVTETSALSRSR